VAKVLGIEMKKEDPLHERAMNLVQAAHINAVAMFTPLMDEFSILQEVQQWDFILTVAGVFMAATRLNNLNLGDTRVERLMEVVALGLDQWNPNGIRGFESCKMLFESEFDRLKEAGHENRFVASDAIGMWIIWNVLGRQPQTDEECKLVRMTGVMVTRAFFDWWEK
jgi:hypothetical protein